MGICILCGNKSNATALFCNECREFLMFYKQKYLITKQLNETTELDETVFEKLYDDLDINTAIQEDRESIFHDPTPDNFIKIVVDCLNKKNLSSNTWMKAKEGRFDRFLQYVEKRIREVW